MLPTVFLSLEGGDENFVAQVQRFLPDGLAYFYPRSFENGEQLIQAMETRVGEATMFALFASKKSARSPWVGFEIDRARLAKIRNPKFRIIVIPIDRQVTHADLPAWMREYWVDRVGNGPREVARYIRRSLISNLLSHLPGNQVYGRGALVDQAVGMVGDVVLRTEETPNVVIIAGTTGIGRRTFTRKFLTEAFPASPELNYGPDFLLPQFADLADLYRVLRQEIETDLRLSEAADDIANFTSAPIEIQAREVAHLLSHFGDLGQAITIISGNGIYEDRGFLKPWAPELFKQLANDRQVKLLVVTNRLIHENESRPHSNVLQIAVPPLTDTDIRTLMIGSATALGSKPELPSKQVIRTIGGHPGIARATAALVARKGPAVLDSDPSDLFALQEDVLGESLNFANLSPIEKDVLSVLSWVPQIAGDTLRRIILQRHQIEKESFAEAVSGLILACLVEVSGSNYLITGPVRSLFRRLHGYGSRELLAAFSVALKDEWEQAKRDNEMRADLLDALAYMAALEGGTLPPEFKALLLPSTLQEVVRESYDRGHDDPDSLARAVSWGMPALKMGMDETTREEILSYVVRALTRLGDEKEAEELLGFIEKRGYRSRFYLRAFYLRVHKGDYRAAITMLLKARDVKKYTKQVVGDLGRCYQRLGMWPQLIELVKEQEQHIGRNSVLLDVRIGMLIAQGDFEGAEREIRVLRSLARQETFADGRVAMLMMRRDQDFDGAKRMLTEMLQRGGGSQTYIRKLRALAAASAGDITTARADAEFLKARVGNNGIHAIEARILLAQGDPDGAEQELRKTPAYSIQDELLRARILEARANASSTRFSERDRLKRQAAEIRARNRTLDEFEVER
ncbi:TIR domain-containing protein [Mesorhizobium australafricanum]|uniref:TIR domain-containing protein n=1 Tax=Mesorhizobium australafricanum TaxID=3072311 RepID=A0ABU4X5W0_9HYPH|nr:TIR domain-containing protein [Mesorhizobium sp. VK3E]MDX8443716.1 TIR domain-containing protein [Mesorhizobium sp. VK3E]